MICDGGTDRALIPIINWAIHRLDPGVEILEPDFRKRQGSLQAFLQKHESNAMLIFVHRDSEKETRSERLREFEGVDRQGVVPLIPVRMTEAWLLFDSLAIARAADAPGASVVVPSLGSIETLPDPKALLEELLLEAAGNPTGRKRKMFKRRIVSRRVSVASLISDYAPLEQLPAFAAFQAELKNQYPYPIV